MEGFEPSTYGDRIAAVYDDLHAEIEPGMIDTLARLAGDGPALELGIGTGRIALPLKARGVEVHGIDASEAMVARLRAKPGGDEIPVTIADFAGVPVDGHYPLVFVGFNTFYALLTQDDQLRCLTEAGKRLTEGGAFAVEGFVADPTLYDERGQRTSARRIEIDRVLLEVARIDLVGQRVTAAHVWLSGNGVEVYPIEMRWAWVSELDLMARLAGLALRERWSGWNGQPFTSDSGRHVSVYERA